MIRQDRAIVADFLCFGELSSSPSPYLLGIPHAWSVRGVPQPEHLETLFSEGDSCDMIKAKIQAI